jgi:thioesterase domain-containing protein
VAFAAVDAPRRDGAERRLRARLRRTMPHGLQPVRLHVLDALPRLGSGKVDRQSLCKLDEARIAAPVDAPEGEPTHTEVGRAVDAAWAAFLPQSRRRDAAWDEEGGDSLTLLNFVLRLEGLLGRRLNLEYFQPDMTREQFVRAASLAAPSGRPGARDVANPPRMFFFPGMLGDGPATARLRAKLSPYAAFIVLHYTDVNATESIAPTLEQIARRLADVVERAQPSGELRFLGYSFGGGVACETAAQLIARGRTVGFVGILDTDLNASKAKLVVRLRRLMQVPSQTLGRNLAWRMTTLSTRYGRLESLFWVLQHMPMTAKFRTALTWQIQGDLRVQALRSWREKPAVRLPLHATLFRSQEPRRHAVADLGWSARFRTLKIVVLSGSHLGCVEDEFDSNENVEKFAAALG